MGGWMVGAMLGGCSWFQPETPAPDVAPAPVNPPPALPPVEPGVEDRTPCTLSDDLSPLLAARQAGGPVQVHQAPRSTIETLQVGGTPVRLWQGGCVHYAVVLEFTTAERPADPVGATQALLEKLVPAGHPVILTSSVADVPLPLPESGLADYACGDAWCEFQIAAVEGGFLITASYDFPL